MTLQITGKNLDIGEALKAHINDKIDHVMDKYIGTPLSGNVRVEKERSKFLIDCSIQLQSGLILQSHGESTDAYAGVDEAIERLEKRLRRYKRRLKKHNSGNNKEKNPVIDAVDYVIQADQEEQEINDTEELVPLIVAETRIQIQDLAIPDAVMQLDISSRPFLVFKNAKDGQINIVYKRPDGHIGWIDPS